MGRSLWYIYLYGNVHISVCAALFSSGAFTLFHQEINFIYVGFVGISTLFGYNLHRLCGIEFSIYEGTPRHDVFRKYYSSGFIATAAAGIGSLVLWLFLDNPYKIGTSLLGSITLLYIVPFKEFRLRNVAFLKIGLVGFCWMGIFLLPCMIDSSLSARSLVCLGIEKISFIIALTIPFDWRDKELDKLLKVQTLGTISEAKARLLMTMLIIIAILSLMMLAYYQVYSLIIVVLLTMVYIVQFLITKSFKLQKERFYLLFLDGFIGLHGIIYLAGWCV